MMNQPCGLRANACLNRKCVVLLSVQPTLQVGNVPLDMGWRFLRLPSHLSVYKGFCACLSQNHPGKDVLLTGDSHLVKCARYKSQRKPEFPHRCQGVNELISLSVIPFAHWNNSSFQNQDLFDFVPSLQESIAQLFFFWEVVPQGSITNWKP